MKIIILFSSSLTFLISSLVFRHFGSMKSKHPGGHVALVKAVWNVLIEMMSDDIIVINDSEMKFCITSWPSQKYTAAVPCFPVSYWIIIPWYFILAVVDENGFSTMLCQTKKTAYRTVWYFSVQKLIWPVSTEQLFVN